MRNPENIARFRDMVGMKNFLRNSLPKIEERIAHLPKSLLKCNTVQQYTFEQPLVQKCIILFKPPQQKSLKMAFQDLASSLKDSAQMSSHENFHRYYTLVYIAGDVLAYSPVDALPLPADMAHPAAIPHRRLHARGCLQTHRRHPALSLQAGQSNIGNAAVVQFPSMPPNIRAYSFTWKSTTKGSSSTSSLCSNSPNFLCSAWGR